MSTVPGNNITLTSANITSATANYIIRTPTVDSNDTFDTATNLLIAFFGEDSANFIGSSFNFTIFNNVLHLQIRKKKIAIAEKSQKIRKCNTTLRRRVSEDLLL